MFLNIMGGLLFSGIGFAAFMYGKRMGSARHMWLGAALMVYPYFVSNPLAMLIVGVGLTALLFNR